MSCERSIEPAQVPLGSPMKGQIILGQDGRLAAGILLLEDSCAPRAGQSTALSGGSGGSTLASHCRISASGPGTRTLLHRTADGADR
jgi:hypothetical protein